jgi:hypothetical protein
MFGKKRFRNVLRCVYCHAQNFTLNVFYYFYLCNGSRTSQVYSIGPDWDECCFAYENFHVHPSSQCILVFSRGATRHTWHQLVEEGVICMELGQVYLRLLNVTRSDLLTLSIILHFWSASRLVCGYYGRIHENQFACFLHLSFSYSTLSVCDVHASICHFILLGAVDDGAI